MKGDDEEENGGKVVRNKKREELNKDVVECGEVQQQFWV